MRRSLIALLAVVFAASAAATVLGVHAFGGSTAGPTEEPDAFVSRIVSQIVSDDYATAWTTLYPPHQAVAGSDEYVACEMQTPVGLRRPGEGPAAPGARRLEDLGREGSDAPPPPLERGPEDRLHAHVQHRRSRLALDVDPHAESLRAIPQRFLRHRLRSGEALL